MVLMEGKKAKKLIDRARMLASWDSPGSLLSEGSEVFVKIYDETIAYSVSLLNSLMESASNVECYFVVVNPNPYDFYNYRYGILPVGCIKNPADESIIKEIFFTNYDEREGYFADLKTIGEDWVILTDSNDWYIYGSRLLGKPSLIGVGR